MQNFIFALQNNTKRLVKFIMKT